MRTGNTVTDLALYDTECCSEEMIFDTGDIFLRCPSCQRPCVWELEEELVTPEQLDYIDRLAA